MWFAFALLCDHWNHEIIFQLTSDYKLDNSIKIGMLSMRTIASIQLNGLFVDSGMSFMDDLFGWSFHFNVQELYVCALYVCERVFYGFNFIMIIKLNLIRSHVPHFAFLYPSFRGNSLFIIISELLFYLNLSWSFYLMHAFSSWSIFGNIFLSPSCTNEHF